MTLIKSISGIRGTIGGKVNNNLTPIDAVKFAAAYGMFIKERRGKDQVKIVIGRDARISGKMISGLVINTLIGLGVDVVDLGLSTTPTVELAVPLEQADGGIILTASHNPKQWNALKLLNEKGEFLSGREGKKILEIAAHDDYYFSEVEALGNYTEITDYIDRHVEQVLNMELVEEEAIRKAKLKVVVDAVNSTGGIAIPTLLEKLGVECIELYCEPNGHFPHNPEPLKEHLEDISNLVVKEKADLGIVVDPDVDRLAIVNEDGSMFGEEYTLVACADYVLGKLGGGHAVSNLSSSRALSDIAKKHGGIIYPASHYGRDSLVGLALFLTHLAHKKVSCKTLRGSYPSHFMSKSKIELTPEIDVDEVLKKMVKKYAFEEVSTIDGVKIDFETEWVHLRKSNTEPIIRIYIESTTQDKADALAKRFIGEIELIIIS